MRVDYKIIERRSYKKTVTAKYEKTE